MQAKIPFDDPNELLYLRILPEHVDGDAVLSAAVSIPDWSTNRSSMSVPSDVLDVINRPTHTRVGQFTVGSIPERIGPPPPPQPGHQAEAWLFWPEHDPVPGNPAHSEVRMRKDGEEYVPKKEPSSSHYRKHVRKELAKLINVII
jgi:hypothetical protein